MTRSLSDGKKTGKHLHFNRELQISQNAEEKIAHSGEDRSPSITVTPTFPLLSAYVLLRRFYEQNTTEEDNGK
jgi:hypothetical protein